MDQTTPPPDLSTDLANLQHRLAEAEAQCSALKRELTQYRALVSEHQQTVESLRESEARYRLLSEHMGDVVWLLDVPNSRFIYVSPSVERLRGYTPEEVLQQPLEHALTPQSLAQIQSRLPARIAAFMNGVEEMRVQSTVVEQPTKWGTIVPTEVVTTLLPDEHGNITRILGVSRDISERLRVAQVLSEKDELLREMSRMAKIGGWEFDTETLEGTWTDEVAHIHDLDPADPTNVARGLEFYEGVWRDKITGAIQAVIERGERYDLELELVSAKGVRKWVRTMGYPIYKQGKIVKIRGIFQDITERKRTELELQAERALLAQRVEERTADLSRANAELSHALRAKDDFLATMSHELRTPLNAILGISESLRDGIYESLSPRQTSAVGLIEQSGRRLLALISDILDLSKIEAGTLDMNLERISVSEISQSSLNFIREAALKKQIQLHLQLPDPTLAVQADPRRLKQILVNLLSNAVKFTPNDGDVTLEIIPDRAQEMIGFVVKDTGIGIAKGDIQRLFTPFTQLDSRLSRQFEGTGLGLALVQRLTTIHGGHVMVESEGMGMGSRFMVYLPWKQRIPLEEVYQAQPQLQLNDPFTAPPPIPQTTILYVEDNQMNIETVCDYLEVKGYRVEIAQDGIEAIRLAEALQPDLILMDIQLPLLDGLSAIRRLRTNPRFVHTPIIALTALAMPGDRERCLEAGANDYLTKPVGLKKLLALIERLLAAEKDTAVGE